MKISVIMVDGSFRENLFGAEYFTQQDFPKNEYEVIWVEFYKNANPTLEAYKSKGLQIVCLGNDASITYHSSVCFNEGIKRAKGEVIVIPDADQIVEDNYLSRVWEMHSEHPKSAIYGYRFDEISEGLLNNFSLQELKEKCVLKNLQNFGGCLSVRKKYLLEINGYDEHFAFSTGFHANGTDINQRLKNLGLGTIWDKKLKLYHPWHPYTLASFQEMTQYNIQLKVIDWKAKRFETQTFLGIDSSKNITEAFPFSVEELNAIQAVSKPSIPKTGFKAGIIVMFPKLTQALIRLKNKPSKN